MGAHEDGIAGQSQERVTRQMVRAGRGEQPLESQTLDLGIRFCGEQTPTETNDPYVP